MSVASWVRACAGTAVVVLSLAACGSSPSATGALSTVSDAGAPAGVGNQATVPGAPTGVSATAGLSGLGGQALVWWTASASDGGSAITGYTVTSSPGGPAVTSSVAGTAATVTGLTNGTSYTFTVTATNAFATSPASEPSNAVIPTTVPGAPTGVSATAGNGQASVSWTAPTNGGSAITGYTVTSSPSGPAVTSSVSGTAATVTGLTNATAYTFTVTATNAVGTGAASEPSNAVTPTASSVTCVGGGGAAYTCVVGNTGPGGGIVFYVNEANATGSRYMEAAPNTWSGGGRPPDPSMAWSGSTRSSVSTSLHIGTGSANTAAIIAKDATPNKAATAVRAYTGGGVSWFLPSADELNELYSQRNVVGGLGGDDYWSSSQASPTNANYQNFANGHTNYAPKNNTLNARPVRAF